jgi:hypothetical protein
VAEAARHEAEAAIAAAMSSQHVEQPCGQQQWLTRVEPDGNTFDSIAAFNHLQTYMGTLQAAGRLDADLVDAAEKLGLLSRPDGTL